MAKPTREAEKISSKPRAPKAVTSSAKFDPATHTVSFEEAAQICGVTPRWLRELERNGFFAKQGRNEVRLRDAIAGLARSIHGVRPPDGYVD